MRHQNTIVTNLYKFTLLNSELYITLYIQLTIVVTPNVLKQILHAIMQNCPLFIIFIITIIIIITIISFTLEKSPCQNSMCISQHSQELPVYRKFLSKQ